MVAIAQDARHSWRTTSRQFRQIQEGHVDTMT